MLTYLGKVGCILSILFALLSTGQAQENSTSGDPGDSVESSLRQKAESGDREAQYALGLAAQSNHDYLEAVKWYRRSADQGLSGAQVNLGLLYDLGLGVEQDPVRSAHWFILAAAQDDPDGEFDLGICYLHGSGIQQDWEAAIKWFTKALSHGDDEGRSANGIALAFEHRPHQDKNKDYAEAFRWYLQGAQMGFGESQYNVCRFAAQGLGGANTDYQQAMKWCSQLAESGDDHSALGQFGMGRIYEDGLGVPKNSKLAAQWYTKSAEQGSTFSQMALAKLYSQYSENERNLVQAYMWTEIAAALNDPTAPAYLHDLDSQMPRVQVAEAQALAGQWIKKHPPNPERTVHVDIDGKSSVVLRPD